MPIKSLTKQDIILSPMEENSHQDSLRIEEFTSATNMERSYPSINSNNSTIIPNVDSIKSSIAYIKKMDVPSWVLIALPLIPTLALLIQSGFEYQYLILSRRSIIQTKNKINSAANLVDLITKLQDERLFSTYFAQSVLGNYGKDINISEVFSRTDEALDALQYWKDLPTDKMFQSKLRFQIRLDDFRELIVDKISTEKILQYYNFITALLLDTLSKRIKGMDGTSYWRFLISYKNALRAVNSAGISAAIVLQFYHNSDFQPDDVITLLKYQILSQEYLSQTINFVPEYRQLSLNILNSKYYQLVSKSENDTLGNTKSSFNDEKAYKFLLAEGKYIKNLRLIQDNIERKILDISSEEFSDSRKSQIIGIFLLCLLISISFLIAILTRNSTKALKHVILSTESHVQKIADEKSKLRKSIFKRLPIHILKAMKKEENTSVTFPCISLLMIHVVNHYKDIESMEDMIPSLNKLFRFIEKEVKNHNIEMNEFINDQILISSGTDNTDHTDKNDHEAYLASKIAKFSLLVVAAITQNILRTTKQFFGESTFLKFGIHSGQVTAGVINTNGILKHIILGPGVKEVKEYCRTSKENKIHTSDKIKKIIDRKAFNGTFSFEENNVNEGEVKSYWLVGFSANTDDIAPPANEEASKVQISDGISIHNSWMK